MLSLSLLFFLGTVSELLSEITKQNQEIKFSDFLKKIPKESTGEDELILTFASPICRREMVLGKLLALLVRHLIINFFYVLPFFLFISFQFFCQPSWFLLRQLLIYLIFNGLV